MTPPPLIPARVLFGEPAVAYPTLSPSGTHVAYLAPYRTGLHVWLGSLAERDFHPLTDLHGTPISEYIWARDGRHLLYLPDRDGDEKRHLVTVDLGTGELRDLTPIPGVRAHVVGLHQRVPDRVLVEMNLRDRMRNDLYRVHLETGEYELVDTEPGLTGWLADSRLRVRAAQVRNPDGGVTVKVRDDEGAPWRDALTVGYDDSGDTSLLGFAGDDDGLLLLSPVGAQTVRLLRLSTVTGELAVCYGDRGHDVVSANTHPLTGQVDLVTVERDRTELVALTPDTAADVASVRKASRGDVSVLGRDLGNRRWLVQDNVDDGPTGYGIYERTAGTVSPLFSHQPALGGYRLARMNPVRFPARDGLGLHGYLTFPDGARLNLPTVLHVHGGPWDRHRWGLRAVPQWLANRGYLCLEVNYRGSTGYGRDFTLAGDREWGGRMQDDLMDALGWTISQGYADPDRLAIFGTSYGGYAALVGASFTPEVFRCAVAVAAPVNLGTFITSVPGYWKPNGAALRMRVGDPDTEPEFLWSRSPLSRAGDIRVPVLLAYGRNDPRVPISEAEQMVTALQNNGTPYTYLMFPDEGHGFAKPANVSTFYHTAERFLADNLGGRAEP
ncbi:MAG TPA: S9 family peptidase [Rugosimonospora sp.]|nr:S9 family peptidase [Rugosimonospora sp.]